MKDKILDFTNAKIIFRPLGGSDRKFSVELDDICYILKFTEKHDK